MKLSINRGRDTGESIRGELSVNGEYFSETLEPSLISPVHPGHPAISPGVYEVRLTESPHFGFVTPEVFGVQNRSEIRIHPGNFPSDSLGCILVGSFSKPDQVIESKIVFDQLMNKLKTETEITLEVQ